FRRLSPCSLAPRHPRRKREKLLSGGIGSSWNFLRRNFCERYFTTISRGFLCLRVRPVVRCSLWSRTLGPRQGSTISRLSHHLTDDGTPEILKFLVPSIGTRAGSGRVLSGAESSRENRAFVQDWSGLTISPGAGGKCQDFNKLAQPR